MVRGELERSRAAMRAYSAILEAGRLSGFYGKLECLKNIADFLDLATDQFAISWRIQNYT